MWYLWKFEYGEEWELVEQSEDKDVLVNLSRELGSKQAGHRAFAFTSGYLYRITDHIPTEEEKANA